MNILCLSKRRPLGRDLWSSPYGRFYHLARGLAERGHNVQLALLNYDRDTEATREAEGVGWHTVNALPDPTRYYRYAKSLATEMRADWVIGFSDTWYGICAESVASSIGARSLIDAYDNYESYIPWLLPLHWAWQRSLIRCNAITAAGPALLDLMGGGSRKNAQHVLPMAADPQFTPRPSNEARQRLGLPADQPLVLYSGSMHANRGIDLLIGACEIVERTSPEVCFVFSGRRDRQYDLPRNSQHLGYIADDMMPDLYASADLLVSVNRESAFGSYSHPVKLYEAMSMGVPVIASETPATRYVLRDRPESLIDSEDRGILASKILDALQNQSPPEPVSAGWSAQVSDLESLLMQALPQKKNGSVASENSQRN